MSNRPIPVAKADAMIKSYDAYMKHHGVDMAKQTQSVSFSAVELHAWLTGVLPYADEIRIFPGEYAVGEEHAGRITTILWPYKHGKPAVYPGEGGGPGGGGLEPYNYGTLNP
jgi:hypothetical protein